MSFVWDPAKALANRKKHGVDFADVVEVFQDPRALTVTDDYPSARKATARERVQYEG